MIQLENSNYFFDEDCIPKEQIPRNFTLSFYEASKAGEIKVVLNDETQLGDVINDNAYNNDFYRYHDIFHYSFAALLGWSPCARAMMRRKRKSYELLDKVEDGARATITEEALSMIIFNEAKRKDYFKGVSKVSKTTLRIIKEMTENFEVKVRTSKEWEQAILKAYEVFRFLIENKGGRVKFDLVNKKVIYSALSQ